MDFKHIQEPDTECTCFLLPFQVVLFNTGLHAQRKFFSEMSADDLEAVFQKFRTDFMLFSYNLNFYDNK